MRLDRLVDLLDDRRRPVRAHLREPAQVPRVEAQRDNGIPAARLRLGHDPRDGVVARAVELFPRNTLFSTWPLSSI